MGAKHSFRSPTGGVSLWLYALHIANDFLCSRLLPESSGCPIVSNFQTIRAKRGKNEFFFGVLWCFLGILGDNKGQNLNIFLKVKEGKQLGRWSAACLSSCPLVQRWAGLRGFRTCRMFALVLWSCVPCLLSAFLLCLWCVACKYAFICDFKAVFSGFLLLDVYLYRLRSLR